MQTQTVIVNRDIQYKALQSAEQFRQMQTGRGTLVVNLISSPGAGKTSLLEATAKYWAGTRRMGVLVGDIATDRDAQRLTPLVPTIQLTTGGACHLELSLIERGLERLTDHLEFLFIENVGNLVCPASHDLGEHIRVCLLSVTEGDDKPAKYPKAFRTSHTFVISKIDLLPYVPFSIENAIVDAKRIQSQIVPVQLSSLNGTGISTWCDHLDSCRENMLNQRT